MDWLAPFHAICLECGMQVPPLAEWRAAMGENYEVWPFMRAGLMVGGALFFGQTVHIAVRPSWQGRWITPAMVRAYPTWAHPGQVWADIRADNIQAQRLATRLGFTLMHPQPANLPPLITRYAKEPANDLATV